jgi:hypothetical protein
MRLSKSEVQDLMLVQSELNENFTVTRWDDALVKTAFLDEYSEMMRELQPEWKVWKQTEYHIKEAEVEFIDCVHFGLSLLLLRAEADEQGYIMCGHVDRPFCVRSGEFLKDITKATTSFVSWDHSYPLSLNLFIDFIEIMTDYFNMDKERFLRYFETKAQINRERVAGGYAEGNYDGKSAEIDRF